MRLIVLGGTSAIAEATARLYARDGASILLVGRDGERLAAVARNLKAHGAAWVESAVCDLAGEGDVFARMGAFEAQLGGVDHCLLAYGSLGEQREAEADPRIAERIFQVNFNSAAAWCLAAASLFERQGRGVLVVIGSVAGDRGRRANFAYGAAKAGLAALVEGIAHRFADKGPRAVLVKPGPTDTPMTRGFSGKGGLWAQPEQVAKRIYRRARAGGPIAYAPGYWWPIMLVIRNIPARLFNRMDL